MSPNETGTPTLRGDVPRGLKIAAAAASQKSRHITGVMMPGLQASFTQFPAFLRYGPAL
jgi:hypothetical protein